MFNKLPSISRLPKHATFKYKPRYYDSEKQDREDRRKLMAIQHEMEADNHRYTDTERVNRFDFRSKRKDYGNDLKRYQSNVRLVAIIIVLATISWYIFF